MMNSASRARRFRSFQEFRDDCVEHYLAFNPTTASFRGLHQYDSKLENFSSVARHTYQTYLQEALEILKKEFSGSCIDRVEQFERRALAWKLEEELFTLTELRPFEWNPLWYDT